MGEKEVHFVLTTTCWSCEDDEGDMWDNPPPLVDDYSTDGDSDISDDEDGPPSLVSCSDDSDTDSDDDHAKSEWGVKITDTAVCKITFKSKALNTPFSIYRFRRF